MCVFIPTTVGRDELLNNGLECIPECTGQKAGNTLDKLPGGYNSNND